MQKIAKADDTHSIYMSLLEIGCSFPSLEPENKTHFSDKFGIHLDGKDKTIILEELHSRLQEDSTYHSGKIMGAMTQPGHDFAQHIYSLYNGKNLGDPGLVKGSKKIEEEVVRIMGHLLGDHNVQGNIVSGGTEANIIAMLMAKNMNSDITRPNIIVPDSAHYSFDKASLLMGFEIKRARLLEDDTYQVDMDHYESLINEHTIALVGVAGTTGLGLVDPIEKMGKLALKHNIFFHVDGAFGGFILPFLECMGHKFPKYNLKVPGVSSFTVDPHKFGMGINPSGGILIKDKFLDNNQFMIPYLAGGGYKSFNILGTRPAASAISFWALLQHLGKEGYTKVAHHAWETTQYLKDRIESIPELTIVREPETPVLGLKTTELSPYSMQKIIETLREKGWSTGFFKQWDFMRTVMMPHITKEHIDEFTTVLKSIF